MPVAVHVVDHPLIADSLTRVRDVGTPNALFRQELERIGTLLIAEATKGLPTHAVTVQTPLTETLGRQLSSQPVMVPVLRAGPPISSDSETIVKAYRAGGAATYYGVSLSGDGATRRIAGDFDPVGESAALLTLGNFSVNSSGAMVFLSAVLGAGYPKQGLFASVPGTGLQMIASSGDGAPGGGRFSSFGPPQLSNKPEVYFFSNLDAGAGIFVAAPDQGLKKVARVGDPWPGGPASVTIAGLNNSLSVNDNGQVGFLATSSNPGRPGLFVGSGGDAPARVVEGTGPAPSGTFNGLLVPFKLTPKGEVLFNGNYGGPAGGGSGPIIATRSSSCLTAC